MPGGNTRTTLFQKPHPLYASHGSGCRIFDVDGNERIDFSNNYTSLIHGHAKPEIIAAVSAQLARGTAFSMPTEAEIQLAELLVNRVPAIEQIRFCNSGTEAVMMAIKAARAYTGRTKIAKFEGAYHGTYDYVEVSQAPQPSQWGPDRAPYSVPLAKGTPPSVATDVIVLPFDDADACSRLIEHHARQLAAVIIDPLPNRVGLLPATAAVLRSIRAATDKYGIVLISDEVISFRLGYRGASYQAGIKPDLITLGKIIGGGFAIGAVGGSATVMSVFDPRHGSPAVPHGGTFSANPMAMTAGKVAMDLYTENEVDRINRLGDQLRREVTVAFETAGVPGQVTGAGSLFRIHMTGRRLTNYRTSLLTDDEKKLQSYVLNYLTSHGIHITGTGMGCLSTAMTTAEVDQFVSVLKDALRNLPKL